MVRRAVFARGSWQTDGGWTQKFVSDNSAVREEFGPKKLSLEAPERFHREVLSFLGG